MRLIFQRRINIDLKSIVAICLLFFLAISLVSFLAGLILSLGNWGQLYIIDSYFYSLSESNLNNNDLSALSMVGIFCTASLLLALISLANSDESPFLSRLFAIPFILFPPFLLLLSFKIIDVRYFL